MTASLSTPQNGLRVAIAGAGRMAHHHATAVPRAHPGGRVVAVADPSAKALEAFVAAFPGVRAYPTLRALLDDGGVDVVHVVTPPATHAESGRMVLEAGAHLYMEKPFTEHASDAEALLTLADARGLKVCAGHQLLFERPTELLRQYLPALREIAHVESYFSFRPVRHAPDGRTPLRPDLQLLDVLPHPVYLLLSLLERASDGELELTGLTISPGATVHAILRRGGVTGVLIVTLEGRPVESYLRVTGRNGSLVADYVRGTMHSAIGPGTSGIDKALAPYRLAWQAGWGTSVALARRVLKRQRSYPGLAELIGAFYASIRGTSAPLTNRSILDTVRVCARVAETLRKAEAVTRTAARPLTGSGVLVTGGTGFLGRALVRVLHDGGHAVRCIARREPAPWERVPGVEYCAADLSSSLDPALFAGVGTIIHCAAATAGGWDEHQRHSIDATAHLIRGAAAAGVKRLIHVSSLAVLAGSRGSVMDDGPLHEDSRGAGPYVWGQTGIGATGARVGPGSERGHEGRPSRPHRRLRGI